MVLRRPAPRFVVWVALLIGVAAACWAADLSAWIVVALEFSAWVLVAMCERALSHPWTPAAVGFADTQTAVLEPLAAPTSMGEPPPDEAEETIAEEPLEAPSSYDEPLAVAEPPAASVASAPATRWSTGTLDQIAQEHAADNEELGFLVMYLK